MSIDNFDFGAELASAGGFTRENPAEGLHAARLRSIIHMGKCQRTYSGKLKDPCNSVVAVFELKEDSDVHSETGEPLVFHVDFDLKDGDKSYLNTKFLPAMLTKSELESGAIKGFDDLIGKACQLDLEGSKAKNDDGTPKYINLKSMSPMHAKLVAITEPLKVSGAGHCRLAQLSAAAMDELNPYLHVQMLMMTSEEWKSGTHPGIALVDEIRKERPDYAKAKAKDEKSSGDAQAPSGDVPAEKLSTEDEF
ncbi:hypothetical protein vBAspATola_36 [Aeromonas phage vB_AspA_Tola]|nr:hypothetical protein vBAspATola_36 [Aeromonas phage vB_AspA_Tola]